MMSLMKRTLLFFFIISYVGRFDANAQSYNERYLKFVRDVKDSSLSLPELADKMSVYLKGSIVPDFVAETLEGKQIQSKDLRGRVVVLYFWNTKCKPCIKQMPELQEQQMKHANSNVVFISLFSEDNGAVKRFLKGKSIDFTVIPNSEHIAIKEFKLPALFPYTIIINQEGKIIDMWFGTRKKKENIDELILNSVNEGT